MILKTCGEGDVFKELGANTKGCLTLDCYERAWKVKLKAPNEHQLDLKCNCYLHGDIGAYDTCSHFCRYVMLIVIRLQFIKIAYYMIRTLAYLLEKLSKTAIIKESAEKSWIVDTNYTQDSLF